MGRMNLFQENISDKIKLSDFKKPVKKIAPEKAKVEKRLSKVSSGDVPPFKDQELRKRLFPNNPPAKPTRNGIGGTERVFVSLKCKAVEPKY